jgi:UDP-glucuronate 4-epimerase
MHVLVTGGAGFIGSHTAEALLSRGERVTVIDAFDFGYDPALKERNAAHLATLPGFRLVRGDIRDVDLVDGLFRDDRPDLVVHLAARAGVRPSLEDPVSYSEINITGTIRLLEAMRNHGVERMVFASSSSVYGARAGGPFHEDDRVDMQVSPYAASKKAAELMCATWYAVHGVQTSALRFFTVYGPRQRPEMAISLFARKIAAGEEITLFGDGSSLRDYTFVGDIVAGVLAAVDKPLGYEVLNIGNGSPVRLDHLVRVIGQAVGREPVIRHLPDQLGDVPLTFADISKARELLGYAPQTTIEAGVGRFVEWMNAR